MVRSISSRFNRTLRRLVVVVLVALVMATLPSGKAWADHDPEDTSLRPIVPIMECVVVYPAHNLITAYWGYHSHNVHNVTIPDEF